FFLNFNILQQIHFINGKKCRLSCKFLFVQLQFLKRQQYSFKGCSEPSLNRQLKPRNINLKKLHKNKLCGIMFSIMVVSNYFAV
uniref:Uncharacterized protein n=1 Tax=Falco tinnunculus TaxID=100819 RepID=A0A8C4VDD7_FALTI